MEIQNPDGCICCSIGVLNSFIFRAMKDVKAGKILSKDTMKQLQKKCAIIEKTL